MFMINFQKILLFLLSTLTLSVAYSTDPDYYDLNYLRYENYIYDARVKTVQLFRKGWNEAFPVLNLEEPDETLHLSFDLLTTDYQNLEYKFIHCDAQWNPSDLLPIEYIDGIEENTILDYNFSNNEYIRYINYRIDFPNRNISLSKSGNYIIVIYDQGSRIPLLTWRFFVLEPKVQVAPDIKRTTAGKYRETSHEVDFKIHVSDPDIILPAANLYVVVTQNQRWDNAIKGLEPRFIHGNTLNYDYEEENIFPAGNEFRMFDFRNMNYNALKTAAVKYINDTPNVYLMPEEIKNKSVYLNRPDINGRFYIDTDDPLFDSDFEGEYCKVHMGLLYPAPLFKADIYVFGQLSNWVYSDQYKMTYNPEKRAYELMLVLKQGFYNYQYLYVREGSEEGDASIIEGSFAQTDNDYSFFVYYRDPAQVYDQLVAYSTSVFPVRVREEH